MLREGSQGRLCQILVAFLYLNPYLRLEKARLRVLHGPPSGPQVADDLERTKHQPVAGRQVPGPAAQCVEVVGADRAGPHHVEAAQGELVHDVAANGWLELALQVHGDHFPAFSPSNQLGSAEKLQQSASLCQSGWETSHRNAASPAMRQASSRLHSRQVRRLGGAARSDEPGIFCT